MAQQVQTVLVDDITGKELVEGEGETITFAVNGTSFEIDLDSKGAAKFHNTLQFYVDHARKVGRVVGGRSVRKKATEIDPAAVRAWAAANKIKVNPRGRIASDVVAQFREAGN